VTVPSLERAIPSGSSIALDTSAVLAYLEGADPVSPLATTVIDGFVRTGRNPALISAVTVTESLVRAFASGSDDSVVTIETFLTRFPNLAVIPMDVPIAREAARVRSMTGLRTPDAIVLATAVLRGAEVVIEDDDRWARALVTLGARTIACHLADHLPRRKRKHRA
jgi:predicted nucleic acid-binding protein